MNESVDIIAHVGDNTNMESEFVDVGDNTNIGGQIVEANYLKSNFELNINEPDFNCKKYNPFFLSDKSILIFEIPS